MLLLHVLEWPNSEPVPCEKEQICPPGSSAPKEDCKGLMTLNNETEVPIYSLLYLKIFLLPDAGGKL